MRRFSLLTLLLFALTTGAGYGTASQWEWGQFKVGGDSGIVSLTFSPDARRLFAKGTSGNERFFVLNVSPGFGPPEQLEEFTEGARDWTDGIRLYRQRDRKLIVTDLMTGAVLGQIDDLYRKLTQTDDPNPFANASELLRIQAVSFKGDRILAKASQWTMLLEFPGGRELLLQPELFPGESQTGRFKVASFSRDGSRIAFVPQVQSHEAFVVGADKLEVIHTFQWKEACFTSISFSPDGSKILTSTYWHGEDEDTAQVWDAKTFENLLVLRGHDDGVTDAAWSPDGQRIATTCWDGKVRVFDANSGAEIARSHRHNRETEHVTFSPDGRWIASSDRDGVIELWDGGWLTSKYRHLGLPELWAAIVLAVLFLWSLRRDWKRRSVVPTGLNAAVQRTQP